MRATILGVMALICVATTAQGQLTGLNHLWTVPGAMNTANFLGTFIGCTNVNTGAETVGLNIYDQSGSYIAPAIPGTDAIPMASGATVYFATLNAAGISADKVYSVGTMTKGRIEILSTASKGIICSAFLADGASAIPTGMTTLTIAKKTKQKGD